MQPPFSQKSLASSAGAGPSRRRRFAVVACRGLVWLYVVSIALFWASLRFGGDRWWWATVLLFGPRWLAAVPLAALGPAALCVRRRLLWPLAGATGIVCFAVLGFCVPWRTWLLFADERPTLRVLTLNIDLSGADLSELSRLITEARPDVVAFQECGANHVPMILTTPEWQVVHKGKLLLASRRPLEEERAVVDDGRLGYWGTIAVRCRIQTAVGPTEVVNVHLETAREGLEAVHWERWGGRATMRAEIERRAKISALASELAEDSGRTLVLGDFNMPVDSAIYRRDWSRYQNAFSRAGWGLGGSKMTRWFRIRIDHVLASGDWEIVRAWLGPQIGSDHRPLIADLRPAE